MRVAEHSPCGDSVVLPPCTRFVWTTHRNLFTNREQDMCLGQVCVMSLSYRKLMNKKIERSKISMSLPSHPGLMMSDLFSIRLSTKSSKSNSTVGLGSMFRPAVHVGVKQGIEKNLTIYGSLPDHLGIFLGHDISNHRKSISG